MTITPQTTLSEAIRILKSIPPHLQKWNEWIEIIKDYANNNPPPSYLIANMNEISFQKLMKLQTSINSMEDIYRYAPQILLTASPKQILNSSAFQITAFVISVSEEMQRIAVLFNNLNTTKQKNNQKAKSTNYGLFALIDWYARRMGITCHEQASQTPWVIVYQCLKIDLENTQTFK